MRFHMIASFTRIELEGETNRGKGKEGAVSRRLWRGGKKVKEESA